ncbi:glycosyltransferase [Bacillus sp. FJAT-49711]|uniref:CgeB family protein n=1 Tax=Bacillus sp. FJAT-49711 TaxID=2833585 RepID=UPI001BCA571B|nr:glycosyltransferase [Bacillus sp. FJAT-49711]MBS4220717.1 glycosyltransferase [Bacillus sp. FJAT-49711]
MRILFLETHPMWIHGLPNGFKDLGHHVKLANPHEVEEILRTLNEFQPHLLFTIGWTPINNTPELQKKIGEVTEASGLPHIYWATEDPGHTQRFSLPYIQRTKPDFVFTICPERIEFYANHNIDSAHLDFGYHSSVHHPKIKDSHHESEAALVANGYPLLFQEDPTHQRFTSLKVLVEPFLELGKTTYFYGRRWNEMKKIFKENVPQSWIKGYLPYTEANKVYSSAKINIGVQNKQTQLTQRTYEILASGGFLLTTDTPAVRKLFTPGKDLIVSSSLDETRQQLDYYFSNPEELNKIRENALKAVKKHSYQARAKYILDILYNRNILPWYID